MHETSTTLFLHPDPPRFLAVSTPEDMARLHWMDDEGSPHPNFSSAIRLLEDIKPLQFDLKLPVAHSATEAWMFGEMSADRESKKTQYSKSTISRKFVTLSE